MHIFHMSLDDFHRCTPGEIYGLVACHLVSQGLATEKTKKTYDYDEALALLK